MLVVAWQLGHGFPEGDSTNLLVDVGACSVVAVAAAGGGVGVCCGARRIPCLSFSGVGACVALSDRRGPLNPEYPYMYPKLCDSLPKKLS